MKHQHRARAALLPLLASLLLPGCGSGGGGPAPEYTVTATAGPGGSITPASATVAHGATASFTLTPDAGFVIDTVSGCGGTLNGDTFTTGPVTADCDVSAAFAVGLVTVSAVASAAPGTAAPVTGGAVTGAGSFNAGDLVTLAARPAPGFAFVDWRENGATVSTRAAYAFTAAADRDLTARFRLAQPLRSDMPASATTALALGDLNGDGHLDMVAVNDDVDPNYEGTTAYVSTRVWLGNGHGAFTDSGQALTVANTFVTSAALGDLDGDGDLDLVLGIQQANSVVLRNDGRGVFTLTQALGVADTRALALGDLDGDGDLDLVEGNIGANRVWLNDGSGTFTDSGQALGAADTVGLALADLDGDGDPDLAAGNWGAPDASAVWLNDGSGAFTDSGQALAGAGSAVLGGALATGDMDGDGDPDLVIRYACASASGTCNDATILYRNDGSGVFTSVRTFSGFTNAVALGDLNGDGHLDLVEGRANGTTYSPGAYDGLPNRVWLGDGQGGFAPAVPVLDDIDNIPGPMAVAAAQLDAAPGPELVVCNNTACDIWAGDAGGNYAGAPLQTLTVSSNNSTFMDVITGDLNGDGAADIVVTGNGTHLFLSDGAASGPAFTAAGVLGGSTSSAALGDLDGDGDPDLVTGGGGTNVTIWKNDGSAGFTGTAITGTNYKNTVRLGDLDGDGDLDLVATYRRLAAVAIYRNDGGGGFTQHSSMPVPASGGETYDAVLADFDGDGRLDLAVAASDGLVYLWRGNGDATFTDTGTLATINNWAAVTLAAADIDGDGDPDLVAGSAHDPGVPTPVTVWINDGAGAFTPAAPLRAAGMGRTYGLAVADIDGDGDPDLIAAHRDGGLGGLSIHRNAAVP